MPLQTYTWANPGASPQPVGTWSYYASYQSPMIGFVDAAARDAWVAANEAQPMTADGVTTNISTPIAMGNGPPAVACAYADPGNANTPAFRTKVQTWQGALTIGAGDPPHPPMDAFDIQTLIDDGTILDTSDPVSRHFPQDLILTPTGLTVELTFDPPQAPGDLFFINWGDDTINECNYDGKDHEYDAAGTYTVTVRENQSSNWTISKQVTVS